jgi:glycosyltransferase involved in cell wall biosynthesis
MRVLMLTDLYPPHLGGAEQYVQRLSQELVARGHQVAVVTFGDMGAPEGTLEDGVRVFRIHGLAQSAGWLYSDSQRRFAPPFPDPAVAWTLKRIVGRGQWDVVHAHNWLVHSFLPLKKWSGAALVLTLHDYSLVCVKKSLMLNGALCSGPRLAKCLGCAVHFFGPARGIPTVLANWTMGPRERAAVDMFLPVSRSVAHGNGLLADQLPFRVIPNFVADEPADGCSEDEALLAQLPPGEFLLFVGDLVPSKGIDTLVRAYAQLQGAPPLVVIGATRPDSPTQVPPDVSVFSSWPHSAVMSAWQRSLIGLVPSVWPEPCATVALEAMSAGRAVVATDVGGLPELVVHGATGLLVPPNDVDAFRDAIQYLIDSPEVRARMGRAGRQRVRQFQAEAVVPQIERTYAHVSEVVCSVA